MITISSYGCQKHTTLCFLRFFSFLLLFHIVYFHLFVEGMYLGYEEHGGKSQTNYELLETKTPKNIDYKPRALFQIMKVCQGSE